MVCRSNCNCNKNPHHIALGFVASNSGWDGNQAWNVCKAGKDVGDFCKPSTMNECCLRECTQLNRGDTDKISNCKYDCGVNALNGCNQGGGGGDQPDRGKKIGENCCRFDTVGGECEVIGTCYENECSVDGDSCYPGDALNKCSSCISDHGSPTHPSDDGWTVNQRNTIIKVMTDAGAPQNSAICVERNIEARYTFQQFNNLSETYVKKFVLNLMNKCKDDPNYNANYNRDGVPPSPPDKGLSTLTIVGIVVGSVIVLIGLILLFISIKKKTE